MKIRKCDINYFSPDDWFLRDVDSRYSFVSGCVTKHNNMMSTLVVMKYGLVPLCNI